jgi:hypothetical protein
MFKLNKLQQVGIIQSQLVDKANYLLGVVEDMVNVGMVNFWIFVNHLKYFYLITKKLTDIIIVSRQIILANILMVG